MSLLVTLAACAAETRELRRRRMANLTTRAAFDLSCEASALRVTCLREDDGWCLTAGVEGCARRATYVISQTSAGLLLWVMDGASQTSQRLAEPDRTPGASDCAQDTPEAAACKARGLSYGKQPYIHCSGAAVSPEEYQRLSEVEARCGCTDEAALAARREACSRVPSAPR